MSETGEAALRKPGRRNTRRIDWAEASRDHHLVIVTDFREEQVEPWLIAHYERMHRAKHCRRTKESDRKGLKALVKDFDAIHEREWRAGK